MNRVCRMPSWIAFAVIALAKAASEPARFSATTVATSLADFTASACMAMRTGSVSPGLTPSFEGGFEAAFSLTTRR